MVEPMHTIDTRAGAGSYYALLNGLVQPRPIAWVSSVGSAGHDNIAPHSYFQVACVDPPIVMFVSIGRKDTLTNIEQTGEFVVNIVDHAHAEQMNLSAANAPYGVSEFDFAGIERTPSTSVAPPRVADAPAALECTVERIIEFGGGTSYAIFGNVVAMHIAERLLDERGHISADELDAIGRLGGPTYSTTRDKFDMIRPSYAQIAQT